MMANEQTSLSRVADHEKLPLLLDKARQFAEQYIDSLEERPVFPGEKFDLKAFHDEILNGGAMPLDLLQKRVEAWIKQQTAS